MLMPHEGCRADKRRMVNAKSFQPHALFCGAPGAPTPALAWRGTPILSTTPWLKDKRFMLRPKLIQAVTRLPTPHARDQGPDRRTPAGQQSKLGLSSCLACSKSQAAAQPLGRHSTASSRQFPQITDLTAIETEKPSIL